MKVAVIQPYYSTDSNDNGKCYLEMIKLMDECDESLDLIVLPEYSDVPAAEGSKKAFHASIEAHNKDILDRSRALAKRCSAIVFVNCADLTETGCRNTTHMINRDGKTVAKYYKEHPAPSEVKRESEGGNELDVGYSYEFREPYVFEYDGIRYGFMTCYDFYFYENFAQIARRNVDIIIGCSHQRTDTHEALSIINRFLCYNTNAYLVRASVSLGEDSNICGCSSVIAPDGRVIVDMRSKIGVAVADIDPHAKYLKPAGFRGVPKAHYEYIEEGRRPWLYRNGGASVVLPDSRMPYPRICADSGVSQIGKDNLLASLGAAVGAGAEEIAFPLDENLEEIFSKFAARVIMNIEVESASDEETEEISRLLRKYDCEKYVYFTSKSEALTEKLREIAPVCLYNDTLSAKEVIEKGEKLGCKKVRLSVITPEDIELAHKKGIKVSAYSYAKNAVEDYFKIGVDTVITPDFLGIK